MLLDALGRPLVAGQHVVFPSEFVGADKMMDAIIEEVRMGPSLDPKVQPRKLIVMTKVIRIPLPMEASTLPIFIVRQPEEVEGKVHNA